MYNKRQNRWNRRAACVYMARESVAKNLFTMLINAYEEGGANHYNMIALIGIGDFWF